VYEGTRMTRRGCNEADGVLEKTRPNQAEPPPRQPQRTRGGNDSANGVDLKADAVRETQDDQGLKAPVDGTEGNHAAWSLQAGQTSQDPV